MKLRQPFIAAALSLGLFGLTVGPFGSNATNAAAAKNSKAKKASNPSKASVGTNNLSFVEKSISLREGTATVVQVRLQKPAAADITGSVAFSQPRQKAPFARAGGDLGIANPRFLIAKGKTSAAVELNAAADDSPEADEVADLLLQLDAGQAASVSPTALEVRVLDANRKILVDVRSTGAVGDGVRDDTKAIQNAVGKAASAGAGVVLFPPGSYIVSSVQLPPGITLSGYGAVIVRPANQGKWTRTFTTERELYAGDQNSAPLTLEGLTFDGSAQTQGQYRGYELEQAHLLFFAGAPSRVGRLVVRVTDCEVRNAVADGVGVFNNVDMTVRNLSAVDVFRGAVVLTGGNSKLDVEGVKTSGPTVSTGIDIEVDGSGNGTRRVEVDIRKVDLDGTLQAAVYDGSIVNVSGLIARRSGLNITNENSTMAIKDSAFVLGAADDFSNRIIYPGQLTFDNVDFQVSKVGTKDKAPFFGLDVWWKFPGGVNSKGKQKLDFSNTRFVGHQSLSDTDVSIGVFNRYKNEAEDSLNVATASFTGLTKTVA